MKLTELLHERSLIDAQIEEELSQLPRYSDECECEEPGDTVMITHHGWFDEHFHHCTDCGGMVSGLL